MEDAFVLKFKDHKFSEFYLCFFGYARCRSLHSFGPAVRPNYILHLVTAGKGKFKTEGCEYVLQKGEGFLIKPNVQTFYQADTEDPWSYIWIGFSGKRAEEYLSDVGINGLRPTFRCAYYEELKNMTLQALKNNTYSVENDFLRESFLYSFFSVLARNAEQMAPVRMDDRENIYIKKAVEYIQSNYFSNIHITDVASYIGIGRGYLHSLFIKYLHISPQEYLISYRISCASELLSVSEYSIEEIALSCGYRDAQVFRRLFKKKTGMTPSEYRKADKVRNLSEQQTDILYDKKS